MLRTASQKMGLSARAHTRILIVARTIADHASAHIAEAINTEN